MAIIQLEVIDTFGEPTDIEVEIGKSMVKGYIQPSGAWILNKSKDEDCVPAEFIAIRPKGKKKWRWFRKDRILKGLP
jgi:hypothetical protein